MLINIGKVWINPEDIVFLQVEGPFVHAKTRQGFFVDLGGAQDADVFASILNTALQTQSFGGEDAPKL